VLLKRGFKVYQLAFGCFDILDLRLEELQHYSTRLFNSAVEVDRAEHSLECIDEERLLGSSSGLFFALPQIQVAAQMNPLRVFDQIRGTHEESFQFRKLALAESGMRLKKKVGDQKAQNRIAEKFELFVIAVNGAALIGMRTVRQCTSQEVCVLEGVLEISFEV